MIYLGIDPGKKGAIATLYDNGKVVVVPFSGENLRNRLRLLSSDGEPIRCCLEQVHAMPKQGVTSTFTFGEGFGYIKGMLEAFEIPYQEIPPQKWKKEFGLTNNKAKSIEVCKRLFPAVSLLPTERSRVNNDGMAEAVLMAEYARRKM